MQGCTGKVRFRSRKDAKEARMAMARRPGRRQATLHIYRCETIHGGCGVWHLTSMSESRSTFRMGRLVALELAQQRHAPILAGELQPLAKGLEPELRASLRQMQFGRNQ